ncbi:MAG: hypothetical protein G01um10145_595 [Microgenomates group bacterium Gr01-1014_5]|nr:MAG: hypothetical protein G01um10145_595 [Microgenomates group bacterium Gr01-1014_5]
MPSRQEIGTVTGSVQHRDTRPSFWSRALRLVGVSSIAAGAAALSPEVTVPQPPKPIVSEAKGTNPATGLAERLSSLGVGIRTAEADGGVSEVTARIRAVAETKYTVDQFGYRVTNAWKAPDGFNMLGYQGLMVQEEPTTGEVRLWNTLDEMNKAGLDAKLDNGSLGVTVPPYEQVDDKSGGNLEIAFRNRVDIFGVPSDVVEFANSYRRSGLEVGVFTSKGKDYGGYKVWRMQRIAVQRWEKDGLIQRILVGDAAKAAGLVPRDAQLASPDLNFGNFSAQPEQPVKTEPTVNVPPLPPGGFIYDEEQVAKALNMPWYRKEGINEKTHTLQLSGKLIDWSVDGNNLVLKIATNKDDLNEINEISFVPQEQDSIWFYIARYPKVWTHYKSTEIASALTAMNLYFKKGDPVYTTRRIRGGPTSYGYAQRIDTWR